MDPQAPRRRFWSSAWISATPTIRCWIDPDLASEPSVGSEDLLLSLAGDVTFDHVMLLAGGTNPGQFDFDRLRIGTTFKDVAPGGAAPPRPGRRQQRRRGRRYRRLDPRHELDDAHRHGWSQGDFNGDGAVNDRDAAILAARTALPGGEGSVPEPSRPHGTGQWVVVLAPMAAPTLIGTRSLLSFSALAAPGFDCPVDGRGEASWTKR